MNHSLFLAGLFALLLSTTAFARSDVTDREGPSPTVVYGDLVTVGASPMCSLQDRLFETGSRG